LKNRLQARLTQGARKYLQNLSDVSSAREMNNLIGLIEIESSKAFTFYDTLFDTLSQRNSKLGRILPGCEKIAADALRRDHPLLKMLNASIVCFNRGYGAAMLREGVPLPYGIKNPVSFMQIPYSKVVSLSTLTSEAHEAGHVAMNKLGLESTFHQLIQKSLSDAGASPTVVDLLGSAHTEIFADVWGICLCGGAYASVSRDLLSVPPKLALAINSNDPHPTPTVRALLLFELCRQLWGRGMWDGWQEEILLTYPLEMLPQSHRNIIREQIQFLQILSNAMLTTGLKVLDGKPITSLFDLDGISPENLKSNSSSEENFIVKGFRPCQQLSLFRYLLDTGRIQEDALNRLMVRWLLSIGENVGLEQLIPTKNPLRNLDTLNNRSRSANAGSEAYEYHSFETSESAPFTSGLSFLARQGRLHPGKGLRKHPWADNVYGLVVHTTGGTLPGRARKAGIAPDEYAVRYYLSSGGTHYVNGWKGADGQQLYQVMNERHVAWGVGRSPAEPSKDQWRSIESGRFELDLPPKVLRLWRARWPGRKDSLSLIPVRSSANLTYIHVECIPCVYYRDGNGPLITDPDEAPMRPGLRFTKAQHETIARLAWDIAHRNAWPSNERWWRSPRLLGHEDITPLSRHDKNGGWDPGALREKPFFDWKYVYDYLEGLRSGDIAASISPSDAGNIRE
jgi:hypothetical protein